MPVTVETKLLVRRPVETALGCIRLAGYLHSSRGIRREKMRILGSYAVVYLVAGGGRYSDSTGVDRDVAAGDLLVLFPEIAHAYGPEQDQPWDEFYIVFDGPVFDLWRKRRLLDARRPVRHLEPIEYWLGRWVDCAQIAPSASGEEALPMICKLQQTLADAMEYERQAQVGERDRAWLSRACALLDHNRRADKLDLHKVSAEMGVSYALFRKKFTRLAGLPPGKYHIKRVIDRASELIFQRGLNNRQLADACGFCDEYHFSKRFHQIVGLWPRDFRKRLPRATLPLPGGERAGVRGET